jgi:methionine-rich copper-binding protein CopC
MMVQVKRFLATSFLLSILFASITSANAHSGLISSNPSSSQILDQIPQTISLTFNEDLIEIEGERVNSLHLINEGSTEKTTLEVRIEGPVISGRLPAGTFPAGNYKISYRVVSADGHPVTGEIAFSTQSPTTIESDLGVEVVYQEEEQDRYFSNIGFFVVAAIFLSLSLYFGVRYMRKSSQ